MPKLRQKEGTVQNNFLGQYDFKKPHIVGKPFSFIICHRSNPTPRKPLHFLRIYSDNSVKSEYFSSLYPTGNPNVWRATPRGGETIFFHFDDDKVFIRKTR